MKPCHTLLALLVAADFVEEGLAGNEAGFRAVMHGIRSLLARFVAVAPERSGAMRAVFVDSVEIDMEGAEFLFVVFVVVLDARQSFHAGIRGRFPLTHHFNNGVSAADF